MARSPMTLTTHRLHSLWRRMRVLYLGRPGLVTKLLALVAFFSIGIV